MIVAIHIRRGPTPQATAESRAAIVSHIAACGGRVAVDGGRTVVWADVSDPHILSTLTSVREIVAAICQDASRYEWLDTSSPTSQEAEPC